MARSFQDAIKIMDAKGANGSGVALEVSAFKSIIIEIHTASSAQGTLNIQGSLGAPITATNQSYQPTWGSAASPTNPWTYLQAIDLADGSVVNGATGIVLSGTDINRQLEVNTNGQRYVNLILSSFVAGTFTVYGMPFNVDE